MYIQPPTWVKREMPRYTAPFVTPAQRQICETLGMYDRSARGYSCELARRPLGVWRCHGGLYTV